MADLLSRPTPKRPESLRFEARQQVGIAAEQNDPIRDKADFPAGRVELPQFVRLARLGQVPGQVAVEEGFISRQVPPVFAFR